jgi:hypothetical protein
LLVSASLDTAMDDGLPEGEASCANELPAKTSTLQTKQNVAAATKRDCQVDRMNIAMNQLLI